MTRTTRPDRRTGEARRRRPGRRAGESRTREAILEAARGCFAARGYDGATIRAIAKTADVDPALVHHFFGTKERLFVEAISFPFAPSELVARAAASGADRFGESLVRALLAAWEDEEVRSRTVAVMRSAVTNERAASVLRGFVMGSIVGTIASLMGPERAELRASLVASQIVGLGVARYVVRLPPLAEASVEDLVAAVGPTLQRYLTADLAIVGGS
jgi:AcrR family transcriptional regulator